MDTKIEYWYLQLCMLEQVQYLYSDQDQNISYLIAGKMCVDRGIWVQLSVAARLYFPF